MPTATDLVTDLPADFETFGQAVATSMADLLGGTTGQILAKNSNTDMDFTWVTNDVGDITAVTAGTGISGGGTSGAVTITNSMATEIAAKGDLIAGTGSQTFDNVSVGTNGQVLTADSTTATGLAWSTVSVATSLGFAAGKNKIINGDFNVNQRAFSSSTGAFNYVFDRFPSYYVSGTTTSSVQAFTPGAAPVAGYEATNFARMAITGQTGGTAQAVIYQNIEDVRSFAGQTVTVSFWAKVGSGTPKIGVSLGQYFGSGGSPSAAVLTGGITGNLSTSWARYSVTISVPSISGKTIGTTANTSYLQLTLVMSDAANTYGTSVGTQNATFDIWGIQAESGSTLTAFQTASGSIQGELALCQRYYTRLDGSAYTTFGAGRSNSSTLGHISVNLPVPMRTTPTAGFSTASGFIIWTGSGATTALTAIGLNQGSKTALLVDITTAGSQTVGYGTILFANNSATTYIEASAEL